MIAASVEARRIVGDAADKRGGRRRTLQPEPVVPAAADDTVQGGRRRRHTAPRARAEGLHTEPRQPGRTAGSSHRRAGYAPGLACVLCVLVIVYSGLSLFWNFWKTGNVGKFG